MLNKLLALTLTGTLLTATVSCGTSTASNDALRSTKTSAYNTTITKDNAKYVPSTYSANRVKYYDGIADTYDYGQSYMYDYDVVTGNTDYNKTYGTNYNRNYNNNYNTGYKAKTSAYNGYRDQRNTTSANYMNNPYMYSNDLYNNEVYTDLSSTDFNNGLITYDHNVDTTTNNARTKALTTNALNATTYTDKELNRANTNYVEDTTMNKVSYDMSNTYEDVKKATKEVVNDVSKDAKKMVRDVKNDVKTR